MENGQNLKIWLNVGDEGRTWMTPSFLSWGTSHYHTGATSEVEHSWGQAGFVNCVVGWSLG